MSQEQFYRIEAYLRGDLSPEEQATLEAEIAGDPALSAQVAIQKVQRKTVELLIEDNLRASVKTWRTELESRKPVDALRSKIRKIPFWAILGITAGLLILVYLLFPGPDKVKTVLPTDKAEKSVTPPQVTPTLPQASLPQKESPQKSSASEKIPAATKYLALANQFREKPDFARNTLRSSAKLEQRFKVAMDLLGQKQYEAAIDSLNKFETGDPLYASAQYNIGCAYYVQGKYQAAIPFLKNTSNDDNFIYADNAQWYLTLSLLASGNLKEAKTQLSKVLENGDGDFFKKGNTLDRLLNHSQTEK